MSINLLAVIQQNLGYPALQKIDPNTQQVVADASLPDEDRFSQAAIPAILTGLYRMVQTDEGAQRFIQTDNNTVLVDEIFGDNKMKITDAIAAYGSESNENAVAKLNAIAGEAVKITRAHLPAEAGVKDVKDFFGAQRINILLHLPAALDMGTLLNDNTLDDNTHKMEGPVSSLMQSIGNLFSTPGDAAAAKN